MRCNQLLCGDTLYEMSQAYLAGARALRRNVPFFANPHRDGSQRHADWAAGHDNEAAGEHVRYGRDLLLEPARGTEFGEDTEVPRIKTGDVDPDWYAAELERLSAAAAGGETP